MRKIAVCVMSRANYGRLKSVIQNIIENPNLELQLIVGASFYNADIPYKVDSRIQCLINSDDKEAMSITTGVLLPQISHELARLKPDIVLVHGDRYEVLACAIAASYMGIPLAHTEGGEDTGCIDDKVRNSITALSDIHFAVTTKAAFRLINSKLNKPNVFVVGSPALDLIKNLDLTNNRKEKYILALYHPNTSKKEDIKPLVETLNNLKIKKIWVNPNVDAGNKQILKEIHKQNFEFVKDLPPEEYYRLLKNCEFAIGNSSSFIKEGAFLGVPAILIGDRQENREVGSNITKCKDSILSTILNLQTKIEPSTLFGDGNSGKKIANRLESVDI